jgi:TatD DNase family protein
MQLIDSHAHLTDPAFNADRDTLIQNLPQSGICACAEIGCAPNEWDDTLALAARYEHFIYAVLGIHPEYAAQCGEKELSRFKQLLAGPRVKAVGEIGLDYTCLEEAGKEVQQQIFSQMITCANEFHKPLVLHIRRAAEDFSPYEDTFALLKQYGLPSLLVPGVLHCFCAQYEQARQALDNGLLLGINGCFTYKKNEYIREAVKKAGLDKLVLETDCPYLSPQGKRGQRNDPSNIPLIAQFVADYLDRPVEEVAEITTQNAKKLYEIP